MRTILALGLVTGLMVVSTAYPPSQEARAWSQLRNTGTGSCSPCIEWNISSGKYFLDASITQHSSWPLFIGQDFAQWNIVSGATNPNFTRVTTGSRDMYLAKISLPVNYCGEASVSSSGTRITQAALYLSTIKTYGGRDGYVGQCDFDNTILHEVGHGQGLGHSAQISAVMYKYIRDNDDLHADDKLGLQTIY